MQWLTCNNADQVAQHACARPHLRSEMNSGVLRLSTTSLPCCGSRMTPTSICKAADANIKCRWYMHIMPLDEPEHEVLDMQAYCAMPGIR